MLKKWCITNSADDSATHKSSVDSLTSNELIFFRIIIDCISLYTEILPDILYNHLSPNIIIRWEGEIPDMKTIAKIKKALKSFCSSVKDYIHLDNCVSFIIFPKF